VLIAGGDPRGLPGESLALLGGLPRLILAPGSGPCPHGQKLRPRLVQALEELKGTPEPVVQAAPGPVRDPRREPQPYGSGETPGIARGPAGEPVGGAPVGTGGHPAEMTPGVGDAQVLTMRKYVTDTVHAPVPMRFSWTAGAGARPPAGSVPPPSSSGSAGDPGPARVGTGFSALACPGKVGRSDVPREGRESRVQVIGCRQ
jgi:hypothetical protein